MPVNRLKLLAFAFGAAVAGLTGTIFAAPQRGVFPADFDLALLITLYAMVILGGAGSLAGVVLGAIVINVSLEVLRTPGARALALLRRARRWRRAEARAAVARGRRRARRHGRSSASSCALVADAVWPRGTARGAPEERRLGRRRLVEAGCCCRRTRRRSAKRRLRRARSRPILGAHARSAAARACSASCRCSTSRRSSGRTCSSFKPSVTRLRPARRAARRAHERAAAGAARTPRVEIV